MLNIVPFGATVLEKYIFLSISLYIIVRVIPLDNINSTTRYVIAAQSFIIIEGS